MAGSDTLTGRLRPRVLIEAAVDSLADATRAVREGADRLEVCHDLDAGGLTPSEKLLRGCLALGVPCVAMARPRAGNFIYTDREFEQMCEAAGDLVAAGAHGVVFGCLDEDQTIGAADVRTMVRLVGGAQTVFHRAFDETPDARAALDTLVRCEVSRVLTSGHARTASDGVDALATRMRQAGARIEIVAGGTVRGANVGAIVERSGVTQVHARASRAGVIAAIREALGRAA